MIVTGMQLASARKIEQVRDYSVCEIPSRIGYCGCGVWLVIPEVRMAASGMSWEGSGAPGGY